MKNFLLIIFLLSWILFFILFRVNDEEVSAKVISLTWRYTLVIEEYAEIVQSDWCAYLPDNAVVISKIDKTHHYTSNYHGKVNKRQPVQFEFCYYKNWQWVLSKTPSASGNKSETLRFPTPYLEEGERVAEWQEEYRVNFFIDRRTQYCLVSREQWQAIEKGDEFKVDFDRVTNKLNCEVFDESKDN